MPAMSRLERAFRRSPVWRAFTGRVVLPWALQGVRLDGEVLEIGSGSGAMAARILERFPGARLTASDYDESIVAVARDALARFGNRARVGRADASALPLPDESFDAVVSFIMLHHVVEWEKAIGEAVRVLRPGGVLVGYDLLSTPPAHWLHAAERARHRLMEFEELRAVLERQPVEPALRRARGGWAVRFFVRKMPAAVPDGLTA